LALTDAPASSWHDTLLRNTAGASLSFARKRAAWLLLSLALIAAAIAYQALMYATVADASQATKFSILMHLPGLIDHLAASGDRLWWLIAIGVPAGLLAATVSYYFVERPFTARKQTAS
jgi:peptidoglycan/LPS O-acetylase OafA/YrhL